MINYFKKIICSFLVLLPFCFFKLFLKKRLTSVFLHHVGSSLQITEHLYKNYSIDEFQEILIFLNKHFTFVSEDEIRNTILNNKNLPDFAIFISFDDGFKSCLNTIAPMLKKLSIPASFFVVASSIDNKNLFWGHKKSLILKHMKINKVMNIQGRSFYDIQKINVNDKRNHDDLDFFIKFFKINVNQFLRKTKPFLSKNDISNLSQMGFKIGSHGYSHIKPMYLNNSEIKSQIIKSIDMISSFVKQDNFSFSFPNSGKNVSRSLLSKVKLEYKLLNLYFSTEKFKTEANFPYLINRINLEADPKLLFNFKKKYIVNIKLSLIKLFFHRISNEIINIRS